MSIYEYDEEATREAIRVEEYERGWEEGKEDGRKEGRIQGREEGIEALVLDNLESGIAGEVIIGKLTKRFGLTTGKAKAYYEKAVAKKCFPIREKVVQYNESNTE